MSAHQARTAVAADTYDVGWGEASPEAQAAAIVQHLGLKGFCIVGKGANQEVCVEAITEITQLKANAGLFYALNPMVLEGLLGPSGSARVAELDRPDAEDRKGGETLLGLDDSFTHLGHLMEPHLFGSGTSFTHRSCAMLHEAGLPDGEPAQLTEKVAHKWMGVFLRHRVMIITFLGPAMGTLELTPFAAEGAEPYRVQTRPGLVVILRPDLMQHIHMAKGKAYALSCFLCSGSRLGASQQQHMAPIPPVVRSMEAWVRSKLKKLKEKQDEGAGWDPEVPVEYRYVMNRMFQRGQMISVRSCAIKQPSFADAEEWVKASASGPDHITAVPMTRWNHDLHYDPEPESWREQKSYCRHGGFMEGMEMFDPKFFNISPAEAAAMDPNQRLTLDVGYQALHNAGFTKNTLKNAAGGVYVAAGVAEWLYADRPDGGSLEATGSALAIAAGRFSFVLGLKGPSFSIDTEASSGLTAVYHACDACQRKGAASQTEFGIAISSHLLLSPIWWPSQCASGWLSEKGRCFSFDASACGYVRADGVASMVVTHSTDLIDGSAVPRDQDQIGSIAGTSLNNNGGGASLTAPSGPAEQEAIAEALRSASVAPWDVDCVAGHSAGTFLADAIEVSSMLRAHRSHTQAGPLIFQAMKTNMGNQVETSGVAALIRAIYSSRLGVVPPNLHLRQANPHLDIIGQPSLLADSAVEFKSPSNFSGVMARGFGGSNVYVLALSERSRTEDAEPKKATAPAIGFWPGGGGALPTTASGYSIVGSWSGWSISEEMEDEGNGVWGCTVTLGSSCVERFQLLADGKDEKVLHPGRVDVDRPSAAEGPVNMGREACWLIRGCATVIVDPAKVPDFLEQARWTSDGLDLVTLDTADTGMPGDQYRVRLQTAGRWQAVTWEKIRTSMPQDAGITTSEVSQYMISASWSNWRLEAMMPQEEYPGLYVILVALPRDGGEFHIVKDEDRQQVIFPPRGSPSGVEERAPGFSGEAIGPDKSGEGKYWTLSGKRGDIFRIELNIGDGRMKVAWRKEIRVDDQCP